MSLGVRYAVALLRAPDGLHEYFRLGLAAGLMRSEEEVRLGEFVRAHVDRYGRLPTEETAHRRTGVVVSLDAPEPPAYYRDRLVERHVSLELKRVLEGARGALVVPGAQPLDVLTRLRAEALDLHTFETHGRLVNYAADAVEIIHTELLAATSLGDEYGLRLGWPTFDAMAGGLRGGDMLSIVGRPAQGKTFLSLYIALHAWKCLGKVPLFVSMEMRPAAIVQRLAAMDTATNLSDLRRGDVSKHKSRAIMAQLRENQQKPDYWIVDGALLSRVDEIITYCRQFRPRVLVVDGAYLVRTGDLRAARWDRVTEVAERLKAEVAEELDIPVVGSYQFNRASTKRGTEAGLEHIAYADAVGQVSSVVLALNQPEDVSTKKQRVVEVLKGRHGETGKFTIRWEFELYPMLDFSEVPGPETGDAGYAG